MGADTKIEWTRHTHNPWIGCAAVSAACDHCYAEQIGKRFGVKWGADAPLKQTSEGYRKKPFAWDHAAARAGRIDPVFCASLADIWDNRAPISWLIDELDTIRQTPNLRWLLLTKRPQLIIRRLHAALNHLAEGTDRACLIAWIDAWLDGRPPSNVWLGTTVENREEMRRRGTWLRVVPAVRRFWSVEPLLEDLGEIPTSMLPHWIIAGGESGPHARPSHPDWFRHLRDWCRANGVAFFFKQWGEWAPAIAPIGAPTYLMPDGTYSVDGTPLIRVGKKAAGALLDGREWREVPA